MARPAVPLELNKKHFTKEEIEFRENNKIKVGTGELKPPEFVKSNSRALKKFKEIVLAYEEAENDYCTNSDSGFIGRYCIEFAECVDLQYQRQNESNVTLSLKIDKAINDKNKLLLAMEKELFLTPLSKVRAIPRKEKKVEDKDSHLFGD